MEPEDARVRETDVPCNCRWMDCPVHPQMLCSQTSPHWEGCPNPRCQDSHYMGEGTLGEDVHVCTDCAMAVLKVYGVDIPHFMQSISSLVPDWMKALEQFVCNAYRDKLTLAGWSECHMDVRAVLALASLILEQSENMVAAVSYLEELKTLSQCARNISRAYGNTHVEENPVA